VASLRNIFRKTMAGAFFTEVRAATHSPRKNLALPQEKLRAFSLPHDSQVQLMFGVAGFDEPALSSSRSVRFTQHRAGVIRRIASARRTSASINTGFSTRPGRLAAHAA
jgi:hypothetical protein